ncbi:YheC/YheD family protein [Effusibacillus lacus]|uniref:ATP-grasp domain-containing protein n=1 Tax=Effusibacillus lacus TaxID=1348429 RepID=A0A292YLE2_9BACL|nr:YheC/YheD family protein [Effusibacillus lacus]TCS71115.1 YheC/D-like protein [Effusibacillus lacus]GAX90758.1 hypothetical protein EFBL_2399 [Effusibacillus lacus]
MNIIKISKIIPHGHRNAGLIVHPETARHLGIQDKKETVLRFGVMARKVHVTCKAKMKPEHISLSRRVLRYLKLPVYCSYDIVQKENEIVIGPFIGILAAARERGMKYRVDPSKKNLYLSNYTYHYDQIRGAILAFSNKGINPTRLKIHGYMYNPENKQWIKGVYRYPASLLKKVRLADDLRSHFRTVLGKDCIFNTPILDKWEMHEMFAQSEAVSPYLPETILYLKPSDIDAFINNHSKAYINPIRGSDGRGIIKVSNDGDSILVEFRDGDNNRELRFKGTSESSQFFERQLKSRQHLIQKAVDLMVAGSRIIDFRLVLVKNETGEWQEMGIFGKYGPTNAVVTNINRGGTAEPANITLRNVLKAGENETNVMMTEMCRLGFEIAKTFESCGIQSANLGIDIALDKGGKMWLIEVNNLDPGHSIAETAGDKDLHYRIRLTNMLFAKRLAGFDSVL